MKLFIYIMTHKSQNCEMLWMRGLELFVEEAFKLWLYWKAPPFTTFIGVGVWKNLREVCFYRWQRLTPGWGPGHAEECTVTGRPVISQGVSGRCPSQEFDSWRRSVLAQTSFSLCCALRNYTLQRPKIMEKKYNISEGHWNFLFPTE